MNRLSTLLDRDYLLDLQFLRQEFAVVDAADPASLRRWFTTHHYLAPSDHARVAGVCLRTIRRWQDAAGLPRARRRRPPGWRRPRPVLTVPPDWEAGTWLEEQYQVYGIRVIARAIGRSYAATRRLLRRRGVVFRPARAAVRSRHPCCNRAWLLEHYVVGGLSLTRCARLAGVSTATLTAWLLRFQIRVRSNGEQQMLSRVAPAGSSVQTPGAPRGLTPVRWFPRTRPARPVAHARGIDRVRRGLACDRVGSGGDWPGATWAGLGLPLAEIHAEGRGEWC